MPRPYELIKAKREGKTLRAEDIEVFIQGYTLGTIPDYQMSAMCMAIFFRGLTGSELAAWTHAMLYSGEVLNLSETPGVKVDKHSTGGVGDKVSLCLAPMVAACGVPVPMISGRGLGHTGGTLDKLESIPGFRVDLSVRDYRRLVKDVGACLIGQTATLAPADKKLYALRDVTATVDCIPLIASSIMSKKMAEGIDALVLDVKVGSGAFMKTVENARTLAQTMIDIGRHLNRKVVALLTDMDQPLGDAIGNALEVKEATDVLKGCAPADLTEVTLALCAEMLVLGQKAENVQEARKKLKACIDDGSAMKKWEEIVEAQGGNPEAVRNTSLLPTARHRAIVAAPEAGFVTGIDSEAIGLAAMALGAGRERVDSLIEPSVGFVLKRKVGASVQKGEALVEIHYNDDAGLENVKQRVLSAYQLGPSAPKNKPLVLERME